MRINTHVRRKSHITEPAFTRRERQIMDRVYATGEISAREIWRDLPDQPTYSTVRTLLAVLEQKGHLRRRQVGKAFLYRARSESHKVAASALHRLLAIFFGGSVERAVAGLLSLDDAKLTNQELARIERLIREARKRKK